MGWILLLVTIAAIAYFLFAPRRIQTIENVPAVVDENFEIEGVVETTEDPREVAPMAQVAAHRAAARQIPEDDADPTLDRPVRTDNGH